MVVRVARFARHHAFLSIAFVLAGLSCIAVPPSRAYLDYFEYRTLMCLFCFLAVIRAMENLHLFTMLAELVVRVLSTSRSLVVGLVGVTLVGSMLISNDMALITFLPLAHLALKATGHGRHLAFVFVMQTVAANLGGMITPFGSPQNLYLYQFFEIPIGEFAWVMLLPFAVSVVAIVALCMTVPNEPVEEVRFSVAFTTRPTLLYLGLFAIAVALVLRLLPVWAGFAIPLVLLVTDRSALKRVDYGLLLTFVLFFVFAGNVSRIPAVDTVLADLLSEHVMLWSAFTSQVLSNVPTAILFAQFTNDYRQLLVGVNIGGVGTVVASLASLITLRRYQALEPGRTKRYLILFSAVNFGLLAVLVVVMQLAFTAGLL